MLKKAFLHCDIELLKEFIVVRKVDKFLFSDIGKGLETKPDKEKVLSFIKFLFEVGPKPSEECDYLSNALEGEIVDQKYFDELINLMIFYGVPLDGKDGNFYSKTPMIIVAELDRPDLIELLYKKGAKLDSYGDDDTPLMAAVRSASYDAVEKLIELGADVNKHSAVTSTTSMEIAIKKGLTKIMSLLEKSGAKKYDY